MTYLEEYWSMIQNKEVVVGYWMRKQVENLINDLDDERFIYDTTEAHKRIKFQETLCLQSKAPYYMKPLKLLPWQKAWWEAVYSFKMVDTGLRRFTEGLLEVARKNGKSTMFAADGNTDLFIGEGGTDICCASNDDRQAKLIFKEMEGMKMRLDPKNTVTKRNLVEISNHRKNITVFRLSSKTQNKDGFNISKFYLDESHDIDEENGQSEIAEAGWRGMSSKDEPLFLNCTTNGFNRDCYLDKKIAYAKDVIRGDVEDIHFIAFIYEQDSEEEIWRDETTWEKSNPSMRYGVKKIGKLRRDVEVAKRDKATRLHLLTKDFNIAQNSAQAWLMLEDFDYPQEHFDLEDFRDSFYIGAVDLSATTDLSNAKIMLIRKDDNKKYVHSHYWTTETKLADKTRDDHEAGAKYAEWERQGLLTVCEGNEVDLKDIADWFYRLYKEYRLKPYKVGFDQRFSKTFTDRMDEYNFETEMILQGKVLSNAMKLTEAELKSQHIAYNSNEIDKWCLGNAAIEMDKNFQVMCVKIENQPKKRIDGAVTLIILMEVWRRYKSELKDLLK